MTSPATTTTASTRTSTSCSGSGSGGYRFSISWPRVLPTGSGARRTRPGLDFYERLVDGLLERDIQPMATLYHWDLPQELEDAGGWLNRDTVDRFAEYAALVGERLADRVEHWIPINEPNVVTMLGYGNGIHAPGKELMFDALPVAHHLLLAHGRAAIALRAAGASSIGCANNHAPMWPASEDEADVGASKLFDALWNGMFSEPMLFGRYPFDLAPLVAPGRPGRRHGDDPAAARLLRRELLQPDAHRRRRRGRPDAVRAAGDRRVPDHRLRLAGRPRRAARVADHAASPLPSGAPADHHHRVGLLLRHGARRGRCRRRPGAHRLPRRPPPRRRRRRTRRGRRPRATTRGR